MAAVAAVAAVVAVAGEARRRGCPDASTCTGSCHPRIPGAPRTSSLTPATRRTTVQAQLKTRRQSESRACVFFWKYVHRWELLI